MFQNSLSKSQFIRGLQCPKSLWLYKFRSKLRTLPDQAKLALFAAGTEVGQLAQKLFSGGKELQFGGTSFAQKLDLTAQYIKSGVNNIYEATLKYDDILVMVDILHKVKDGWEIYEVKSSTSEKEVSVDDIALQYHVLRGWGLNIVKASLIHINNQYVREQKLDIKQLFKVVDLTEVVQEKQEFIQNKLKALRKVLWERNMPLLDIGPQCFKPYECDFKDYCWQHIPGYSIFNLRGMKLEEKFELYKQGILDFRRVPFNYALTDKQSQQIKAELNDEKMIDQKKIKAFLDKLYYPLYFLDFETFQTPIPPFKGIRPFQQIPFQYSLHYLNSSFDVLSHKEFLAEPGTDPRLKLVKQLVKDIPANTCILAYNSSFEKKVIEDLADIYPDYADKLRDISNRVFDLMIPFQQNYVYTKEMKGSYSIKKVLPALVPELSYQGLEINNGGIASITYRELVKEKDQGKRAKVKDNLLQYCKLDTLAMVEIWRKLQSFI
ncbi:DUF2779 domain-containing protein [bacterium]|nr:DUF2779 domain-containing protein [bacterium]MBT3581062.1 DUF2779 domain-containing protein [bacterium]